MRKQQPQKTRSINRSGKKAQSPKKEKRPAITYITHGRSQKVTKKPSNPVHPSPGLKTEDDDSDGDDDENFIKEKQVQHLKHQRENPSLKNIAVNNNNNDNDTHKEKASPSQKNPLFDISFEVVEAPDDNQTPNDTTGSKPLSTRKITKGTQDISPGPTYAIPLRSTTLHRHSTVAPPLKSQQEKEIQFDPTIFPQVISIRREAEEVPPTAEQETVKLKNIDGSSQYKDEAEERNLRVPARRGPKSKPLKKNIVRNDPERKELLIVDKFGSYRSFKEPLAPEGLGYTPRILPDFTPSIDSDTQSFPAGTHSDFELNDHQSSPPISRGKKHLKASTSSTSNIRARQTHLFHGKDRNQPMEIIPAGWLFKPLSTSNEPNYNVKRVFKKKTSPARALLAGRPSPGPGLITVDPLYSYGMGKVSYNFPTSNSTFVGVNRKAKTAVTQTMVERTIKPTARTIHIQTTKEKVGGKIAGKPKAVQADFVNTISPSSAAVLASRAKVPRFKSSKVTTNKKVKEVSDYHARNTHLQTFVRAFMKDKFDKYEGRKTGGGTKKLPKFESRMSTAESKARVKEDDGSELTRSKKKPSATPSSLKQPFENPPGITKSKFHNFMEELKASSLSTTVSTNGSLVRDVSGPDLLAFGVDEIDLKINKEKPSKKHPQGKSQSPIKTSLRPKPSQVKAPTQNNKPQAKTSVTPKNRNPTATKAAKKPFLPSTRPTYAKPAVKNMKQRPLSLATRLELRKLIDDPAPVIWIFGYPQSSILTNINAVVKALAEKLKFCQINLEKQILAWLDATSEPANTGEVAEALAVDAKKLLTVNNVTDVSFPGFGTSQVLELIQLAMATVRLKGERPKGFIIRSFPTHLEEGEAFETRVYPFSVGVYFLNETWSHNRNNVPEYIRPKYFVRKREYSERAVEEAAEAYGKKTLKITNAEALVGSKVNDAVKIIEDRLYFRSSDIPKETK